VVTTLDLPRGLAAPVNLCKGGHYPPFITRHYAVHRGGHLPPGVLRVSGLFRYHLSFPASVGYVCSRIMNALHV
jgi:hypothetical protein